jgi:hypothetical protein
MLHAEHNRSGGRDGRICQQQLTDPRLSGWPANCADHHYRHVRPAAQASELNSRAQLAANERLAAIAATRFLRWCLLTEIPSRCGIPHLHRGSPWAGGLAEGLWNRNGGDGIHRRLLDSALRNPGKPAGSRCAWSMRYSPNVAGPASRCFRLSVVAVPAFSRIVATFSTGGSGLRAPLPGPLSISI